VVLVGACADAPPCEGEGIQLGECAPDFTLPEADGNDWTLSEQQGDVVLLDFSAIWCGFCQRMAPEHQAIAENWADEDVQVVTVLVGDRTYETVEQAEAQEWKIELGIEHPVLYDPGRTVWKNWQRPNSRRMPQQYLIDAHGGIAWRKIGPGDDGEISEEIESLL